MNNDTARSDECIAPIWGLEPDSGENAMIDAGRGLVILRESHAIRRGDIVAPRDLVDAGVTFRVQAPDGPRRFAAISLLGDRMATAGDLPTLFEQARTWLGNHYYHVRRSPAPPAPEPAALAA